MVHTFGPSTWETEAGDLCEFEASLSWRASSRAAKRNCVSTNKAKQPSHKKKRKLGNKPADLEHALLKDIF